MENVGDSPSPPGEDVKPSVAKGKPTQAKRKGRKAVKKKPDDMPRRPLSAYNFFFSEMRTKLLADRAAGNDEAFQKFLNERKEIDGEKKNGFFSNMGKFVAKRWKELTPDELQPYTEQAEKDLQRYRREMDEYREGVARKTRLASEQKLREQEAEAAKAPQMPTAMPGQTAGGAGLQPWGMMGANPMMSFQNPADPSFQLLLRQQLLNAQNPQLNAFLLQQQFGGGAPGGMPGFPGQMGQFGQQPGMSQQGGGSSQGSGGQTSQDPSQQNQGGQQQFPDMQQNQQDLINSMQNRMQAGMYPGMMQQAQYGMPMGMMGGMPPGNQEGGGGGGGGMDQMSQQMQMGHPGQGGGNSSGQWL
mmetsp:Transcript_15426/g.29443  ORF Transcript_15426/g.29443 Transcript_15426/m.29443 type:complete len:358 (-) Transcript_15426:134-1207(-)